jgi:phage shock protein PspC (stress-responsive transcriptional regulator)
MDPMNDNQPNNQGVPVPNSEFPERPNTERTDGFGHNTDNGFGQNSGQGFGRGFGTSGEIGTKLSEVGNKLRYLRRSRNDKVFGGVAGGIAEALEVETVVVRIAIVVLSVMTGVGFLAYLLAWVMIAKSPEGQYFAPLGNAPFPSTKAAQAGQASQPVGPSHAHIPKKMEGRQLMAVAIVSIGVLSLFNRMGINLNGDVLWPLALIGIGSAVLFSKSSNQGRAETSTNRGGQRGPEHGSDGSGGHGDGGGGGGWPGSGGFGPTGFGSGEFRPGGSDPADGSSTAPGLGFAAPAWPDATVASDSSGASARLNPYPTLRNDLGDAGLASDTASPRSSISLGTGSAGSPGAAKPTPDDLLNQARREVDALSLHESWIEHPIGSEPASNGRTSGLAKRVGTIDPRASKKFSRLILGTTLVLGGFFAIALRSGWVSISSGIDNVLAMALIGVGAVLFLGAWFGRPFGFLLLGSVLFALLAAASFVGGKWGDGVGQRAYQPKGLSELQNHYRLGAGTIKLDLSKLDFSRQSRVVNVDLGAGAVSVEVPPNATVAVSTTTRAGEVTLFGKSDNDTNRKFRLGKASNPQLILNVRAGVGAIEVAKAGKLVNLTDLGSGSVSVNFDRDSTDAADETDSTDEAGTTDAGDKSDSTDAVTTRSADAGAQSRIAA